MLRLPMSPVPPLVLALSIAGAVAVASCHAAAPANKAATAPASATGDAAVRKAVAALAPDARVDGVKPTPIPGIMEVSTSHDLVYITSDGKYLLTGSLIEVASKRDLTEIARAAARRVLLRDATPSQMIVFAPAHPKYTITVFTDVDCGFCRKLHSQIADYNKAGIAVDYLFFPRTGIGSESFDKAVSVWCSADRHQAFTDAKKGLPVKKVNCANPVTMDYNLGLKVGVDGTPAIFTADGTQIGGYLAPAEMKAKLDKLAAQPSS